MKRGGGLTRCSRRGDVHLRAEVSKGNTESLGEDKLLTVFQQQFASLVIRGLSLKAVEFVRQVKTCKVLIYSPGGLAH